MKRFTALKWSYILVSALFSATVSFADPAPAAPMFQMRLVVAEGQQSEAPKDAERMALMVTNSATGQAHGNVFWVGKTVLIDQNDLQSTTVVTSTPAISNGVGAPQIDVTFTPEGTKRFAEVSRQSINKRLAIMIDGQIVSAPTIRSEIPGGKAMISGSFTWDEAKQLSAKINQALKK